MLVCMYLCMFLGYTLCKAGTYVPMHVYGIYLMAIYVAPYKNATKVYLNYRYWKYLI